MKTLSFRLPVFLAFLALFLTSTPLRASEGDSEGWSLAVIDQLLAGIQPGQQFVQIDDMEISVDRLTAWRNQLAGLPSPESAFDGVAATWPSGNVFYSFSNNVPANLQKAFLDAATDWTMFANLRFILRTTQANFILVQVNNNLGASEGGQSFVGMIGGPQALSVAPTAWNRGTLCHEIGHALGLVHEHQRFDRDKFVTIITNNVTNGAIGNFVLLSNSKTNGAYDFLSVMHYSRNAFAIGGSLTTIQPLPAFTQFINIMGVPGPITLSAADRAGMALVYGAPAVTVTSVVTNTQDSGPGSLRAALYFAFDHPGTHVTFNIPTNDPGFTNGIFAIQPSDELPWLVNGTFLDGASQPTNASFHPTGPSILINGINCPTPSTFANGLQFAGSNCTVRSLIINGFPASSILLSGTNTFSNTVAGCYLGIDPTGVFAVTNGLYPLGLEGGANANTIGGTVASNRNVIGGGVFQGVFISDPGTTSNVVEGNYIGLNAAGNAAIPNGFSGVGFANGASGNIIGGSVAGAGNVLSGNTIQGVALRDPGTTKNLIEGNIIGLNPAGTVAIPNVNAGVQIFLGAQSNTIGGSVTGARNVISGNLQTGVSIDEPNTTGNVVVGNYIGLNAAGTGAISNVHAGVDIFNSAQSNVIGGTTPALRNIISGNGAQGVLIGGTATTGNVVEGNYIGLNAAGSAAVPNTFSGVDFFSGAQGNIVGGTNSGTANVISGNALQGVAIQDAGTSNNFILGNLIGVNPAGTAAIPNGASGVEVFSNAGTNFIGGMNGGNVVSGNIGDGVQLDNGASSNFVQGNLIGLNAAGNVAIPNNVSGVEMSENANANLIGGTLPALRNIISGNGSDGVLLDNGASFNVIQGNFIGLDVTGTTAIPNKANGVEMFNGANGNVVGGVGGRNYISGNANNGVQIEDSSFSDTVQGNTIGLNISNTAVANGLTGVQFFGGAQSNTVGGTFPGAANIIASNVQSGVEFFNSGTIDNSVRGNSIFGISQATGIYLNQDGANNNQVAPSLSSAVLTTNTTIIGSLSGAPASAIFHIDFYATPSGRSQREARLYLGAKDISTGAGGTVLFTNAAATTVPLGEVITATATDSAGNTSQLSANVTVTGTDSVGDGITDAWRKAHFGSNGTSTNSSSCATCDPDHDGLNNRQEFIAGTDPNNASSALRVGTVADNGKDINVSFSSVQGIVYRVEYRSQLGTGGWFLLADQILGTGGTIQLTDPGAASLPARFYRVDVLP